jgi:hypothetical protein
LLRESLATATLSHDQAEVRVPRSSRVHKTLNTKNRMVMADDVDVVESWEVAD